ERWGGGWRAVGVCVPGLRVSWNCARPPESNAVSGAPPSTLSATVPVGVPPLELTVTVTSALAGNVTAGALMLRPVDAEGPDVEETGGAWRGGGGARRRG